MASVLLGDDLKRFGTLPVKVVTEGGGARFTFTFFVTSFLTLTYFHSTEQWRLKVIPVPGAHTKNNNTHP